MGDLLFGKPAQQQVHYPDPIKPAGFDFATQFFQNYLPQLMMNPLPSYGGQIDPGLSPTMQYAMRGAQTMMNTPQPDVAGIAQGVLGPYMQPPQDSWAAQSRYNFATPTLSNPGAWPGAPRDPMQAPPQPMPGPWGGGGPTPQGGPLPPLGGGMGRPSPPPGGSPYGGGIPMKMDAGFDQGPGIAGGMPGGGPPMGGSMGGLPMPGGGMPMPPGGGMGSMPPPPLVPPYNPVQHTPSFVGWDPTNPQPWLQGLGGWLAAQRGPQPGGPGGPGKPGGGGTRQGPEDEGWFGRWRGPNKGKSKEEVVFDMWTRGWPMGQDYKPPEHLVNARREAGQPFEFGSKETTEGEREQMRSSTKNSGWQNPGGVRGQGWGGSTSLPQMPPPTSGLGDWFGGSPPFMPYTPPPNPWINFGQQPPRAQYRPYAMQEGAVRR